MVDLHVHSTCSDGTFTPTELVEYALTHRISAFALTDHDTTAGLSEAISYAEALSGTVSEKNPEGASVEVIPGIELSSEYNGKDIHIVGLFIDENSKAFKEHVASFLASRETRNHKMCEKLAEYGFDVSYEDLLAYFPDSVITRAHYAKYMMEKGYVKSLKEAFERYLGDHAPCFVPREKISPEQAVSLILSAGGIPVLAHPTLYHMGDEALETLVARLKDAGLLAIEGIYSTYTPSDTRKIQSIAKKFGLAISGGSDFHGENKPGLSFGTGYGRLYIHEDVLASLKHYLPLSP